MSSANPYAPQIAAWLPAAQAVSAATGMRTGLLLALGIHETGLGEAGTGIENNVWGVRYVPGVSAGGATEQAGGFAAYASPAAAAADMIRVLGDGRFPGLAAAPSAAAQIEILQQGGYDGGTAAQTAAWAQQVLDIYDQYGLSAYDGGASGSAGAAAAAPGSVALSAPAPAGSAGALALVAIILGGAVVWIAGHVA